MDPALLYSYERARSQLNYGAAYKIVTAFGLNPEWLATGDGSPTLPAPIPSPSDLGVGARALFSEIYDKHVVKLVAKWTKEWRAKPPPDPIPIHVIASDARSRLAAEAQIVNWLKRLMLCLPDERLQTFLNFIYLDGTKLYRTWPADTKQAFEKRVEAMDRARAAMEATKNLLASEKATTVEQNDCKPTLDTVPPQPHTVGVQNEIRDLKGLVARLKKVTAPRGAKSALAREFKVTRQAVNQWLSRESAPSADLAIRLQYWKPKLPAK